MQRAKSIHSTGNNGSKTNQMIKLSRTPDLTHWNQFIAELSQQVVNYTYSIICSQRTLPWALLWSRPQFAFWILIKEWCILLNIWTMILLGTSEVKRMRKRRRSCLQLSESTTRSAPIRTRCSSMEALTITIRSSQPWTPLTRWLWSSCLRNTGVMVQSQLEDRATLLL